MSAPTVATVGEHIKRVHHRNHLARLRAREAAEAAAKPPPTVPPPVNPDK